MAEIVSSSSPDALTPLQVRDWPVPTPDVSMAGDPNPEAQDEEERVEQLLNLARERFKICVESEASRRKEALLDFQFYTGDQWEEAARDSRNRPGNPRPCLTINRMPGFVKHVVNNMRQARPALRVDPVGDGADEANAQVRQGLLRHIEVNSQADIVYDTSFEHMCIGGIGWMRVVDDWDAPDSFEKELFVRWVKNPFSVYADPFAALPDWSDMKFAFVVEDFTRQEFVGQFGEDREAASLTTFQSLGDQMENWFPGGKIRVAEYFHIEYEDDMLFLLKDGRKVYLSELDEMPDDSEIVMERKVNVPRVHWDLIDGLEVLKHRMWQGPEIPLVPVIGNVAEVNETQVISGMIRYAREPQRLYNFMYSSFAETVALAPRSQFIAAMNQIAQYRDLWERANIDPQAVLPYDPVTDESGHQYPPPQRVSASPDLIAFIQGLQMADQQMKSIFGIFDASLGQRGPQESGLAINARKIESDTSTYDWGDNFIRSLRRLGIILNNLLKFYYNTPGKIMRILRDDDTRREVMLNQADPALGGAILDLSKGRFAVVISTGPSEPTKRQAAVEGMIDFFKLYPAGLQACAHILVGEMDFPGKDKLRAQLEKVLPPALRTVDPGEEQIPDQARQQMEQMAGMIQQLTQAVNVLSDKSLQQERKEQWETYRNEIDNQTKIVVAEAQAKMGIVLQREEQLHDQIMAALTTLAANNVPTRPGTTPPLPAVPQQSQGSAPAAPQIPPGAAQPAPPQA